MRISKFKIYGEKCCVIKKVIPFTIAPRIMKCLGINLTKDVKDLYAETIESL